MRHPRRTSRTKYAGRSLVTVTALAVAGFAVTPSETVAAADPVPSDVDAVRRENEKIRAELEQARAEARQAREEAAAARAEVRAARMTKAALDQRLIELAALARQLLGERGLPLPLAPLDGPAPQPVPPPEMLNLTAVVKAKRNINGTEYATISLGSAQNVRKDMQFTVQDGGNVLGYLTVVAVETEESVGALSGPSVQRIIPGTRVRSR